MTRSNALSLVIALGSLVTAAGLSTNQRLSNAAQLQEKKSVPCP